MKKCLVMCAAVTLTWCVHASQWTNAGGDYKWTTVNNWSDGLPGYAEIRGTSSLASPVVVDDNVVCGYLDVATQPGDAAYLLLTPGGSITCNSVWNPAVGVQGYGHFRLTGGEFSCPRNFIIGGQPGAEGEIVMTAGSFRSEWGARVGDGGTGRVTIQGGSFVAAVNGGSGAAVVGEQATSEGYVALSGGEFVANNTADMRIGNKGYGEVINNGGRVWAERNLVVGYSNTTTRTARLHHLAGKCAAGWDAYIGYYGRGEVVAATNMSARSLTIGGYPDSEGRMVIGPDAVVGLAANATVRVGDGGAGELLMKGGVLRSDGVLATLHVRKASAGHGVVRGWGTIKNFAGQNVNNGLFIADGFGAEHTLAFDNCGGFTKTVSNTGTNGWYAQNSGKLSRGLGLDHYINSAREYTWGDAADGPIDMVNSLRFTVYATDLWPSIGVELLAPDRTTDLPATPLPSREPVIGLWRFTGFNVAPVDIEFRYDHAAAKRSVPQIFRYNTQTATWTKHHPEVLPGYRLKVTGVELPGSSGSYFALVKPAPHTLMFFK